MSAFSYNSDTRLARLREEAGRDVMRAAVAWCLCAALWAWTAAAVAGESWWWMPGAVASVFFTLLALCATGNAADSRRVAKREERWDANDKSDQSTGKTIP